MECLKTFNITTSGLITNTNTITGSNVIFWTDYAGKNTGFSATLPLVDCYFQPQGFKNIDVYSVEVQGSVANFASGDGNFIVNDYFLVTNITGNFPILGGVYGTGAPFQLSQGGSPLQPYFMSKYSPKIEFKSPIQSFSQINFTFLIINGFVPTLISGSQQLNFFYSFDIFVNYKFEGED